MLQEAQSFLAQMKSEAEWVFMHKSRIAKETSLDFGNPLGGTVRKHGRDGYDERADRILVENGINCYAELITRSRFQQMVEGASKTAFSCNFLQHETSLTAKRPILVGSSPSTCEKD